MLIHLSFFPDSCSSFPDFDPESFFSLFYLVISYFIVPLSPAPTFLMEFFLFKFFLFLMDGGWSPLFSLTSLFLDRFFYTSPFHAPKQAPRPPSNFKPSFRLCFTVEIPPFTFKPFSFSDQCPMSLPAWIERQLPIAPPCTSSFPPPNLTVTNSNVNLSSSRVLLLFLCDGLPPLTSGQSTLLHLVNSMPRLWVYPQGPSPPFLSNLPRPYPQETHRILSF